MSRTSVASVTFADPTWVVRRRTERSPRECVTAEYCLNGRLVQRDACQIARNCAPHFARNRDPSWA